MPKRVIDFDAMWGSDKLAACAEWAQAEYAWLYGLADASGCFELTNLRVIWGRVAAIRRNLTIERLEQVFGEFQDKGLLFVWEYEGKRYGHWSGSDVPGRLPPPSWRMRLEKLAPPVPKQQFAEYVSRFARGRAALPGGGFRVEAEQGIGKSGFESADLKSGISDLKLGSGPATSRGQERLPSVALDSLKDGLEEGQAEDWNWDRDEDRGVGREGSPSGLTREKNPKLSQSLTACAETLQQRGKQTQPLLSNMNSNSETAGTESRETSSRGGVEHAVRVAAAGAAREESLCRPRDKSFLAARELSVGRGPSCGPVKVKPEALERIRARATESAQREGNGARDGSRSP